MHLPLVLLSLSVIATLPGLCRDDASAPPDWWRAVHLHQTLRRCDLALPCYERVLGVATEELRQNTLWGIAYCAWIVGDQERSWTAWQELDRGPADDRWSAHARAWASRRLHSGRRPVLYRFRWRWTDQAVLDGQSLFPTEEYRLLPDYRNLLLSSEEVGVDPGPGIWILDEVRLDLAVRSASPFAPWSGTAAARPWPEGRPPFAVPTAGMIRLRLEIHAGTPLATAAVHTVELPTGRRRSWELVGEHLGLRLAGPWQIKIIPEILPVGADLGLGCASPHGFSHQDTPAPQPQARSSTYQDGSGTLPLPRPEPADPGENTLVQGLFLRFPAQRQAGAPAWRLVDRPQPPPGLSPAVAQDQPSPWPSQWPAAEEGRP